MAVVCRTVSRYQIKAALHKGRVMIREHREFTDGGPYTTQTSCTLKTKIILPTAKMRRRERNLFQEKTQNKSHCVIFLFAFQLLLFGSNTYEPTPRSSSSFPWDKEGKPHRGSRPPTNSCKQKFLQLTAVFQNKIFHHDHSSVPRDPGRHTRQSKFLHRKFK